MEQRQIERDRGRLEETEKERKGQTQRKIDNKKQIELKEKERKS